MKNYEKTGVISPKDIPLPSKERMEKGKVAIIECVQEIPCDPCVEACPTGAISMEKITDLPKIDFNKCTGCSKCIAVCPGLAIFIIDVGKNKATITLPYEFLPVPKVGEIVAALDREGKEVGKAKVLRVNEKDKTRVITIEVEKGLEMMVRNIRVLDKIRIKK